MRVSTGHSGMLFIACLFGFRNKIAGIGRHGAVVR